MVLPEDFEPLMRAHLGDEQTERLMQGLSTEPSVSVRMNPRKNSHTFLPEIHQSQVPWARDAYYLDERPAFTFDPLFHAGTYYVQEASSMFLTQAICQHVDREAPLVALDLCAAPGGKSTLIRSLLSDASLLVSNEPMRQRAQVLAENMIKWGHPNTVVTQNYPADFSHLVNTFDLIVTDVPCSGEGMFRKEDDAIRDWSLENVDLCWHRQRDIVEAIWPTLKPGGILIYSTCTFNRFEDEDNVNWVAHELGADILTVNHPTEWNITEGNPGYHFFPGTTRGEGFYMAVLRKQGSPVAASPKPLSKPVKAQKNEPIQAQKWIKGDYIFQIEKERYAAIPATYADLIKRFRYGLNTIHAGVPLAELKGKDWIPCHALAMNTAYQEGSFPEIELTYDEALAYLRKEALRIDAPKGFIVVTYKKERLGFAKSIGNRANNLYPQEWRIRSGYTTPCHLLT